LITTPAIERAIAGTHAPDKLMKVAREAGTRSLWGCGVSQLLSGATSAEELIRVLEPEGAREKANSKAELNGERDLPEKRPSSSKEKKTPSGTKIVAGVVEVYVIDGSGGDWRVLVLQRSADTIRPNSWETVFGKIDAGESPQDAAVREIGEETGLPLDRLYNVNVQSFYLHESQTVQLAIVFAAFVSSTSVQLSEEHSNFEWLSFEDAPAKFTWPRAADALRDIKHLLKTGDAAPVEDVLRVT
jgi:8-oxo-dGTP pyrophosphatase MutT (NUDIX family)